MKMRLVDMHLHTQQEGHDFRDKESSLQDVTTSPSFPLYLYYPTPESTWGNIEKGIAVFGKIAIVGLTMYHLYMIGGRITRKKGRKVWTLKERPDKTVGF